MTGHSTWQAKHAQPHRGTKSNHKATSENEKSAIRRKSVTGVVQWGFEGGANLSEIDGLIRRTLVTFLYANSSDSAAAILLFSPHNSETKNFPKVKDPFLLTRMFYFYITDHSNLFDFFFVLAHSLCCTLLCVCFACALRLYWPVCVAVLILFANFPIRFICSGFLCRDICCSVWVLFCLWFLVVFFMRFFRLIPAIY